MSGFNGLDQSKSSTLVPFGGYNLACGSDTILMPKSLQRDCADTNIDPFTQIMGHGRITLARTHEELEVLPRGGYHYKTDIPFERLSASWRRMYLTAPPVTKVSIITTRPIFSGLESVVKNQHGVTMEDIYQCIYDFIQAQKKSPDEGAFSKAVAAVVKSTVLHNATFDFRLEFWPLARDPV
jgi:hypothetical protein